MYSNPVNEENHKILLNYPPSLAKKATEFKTDLQKRKWLHEGGDRGSRPPPDEELDEANPK